MGARGFKRCPFRKIANGIGQRGSGVYFEVTLLREEVHARNGDAGP
jgi:hypothetical protein